MNECFTSWLTKCFCKPRFLKTVIYFFQNCFWGQSVPEVAWVKGTNNKSWVISGILVNKEASWLKLLYLDKSPYLLSIIALSDVLPKTASDGRLMKMSK